MHPFWSRWNFTSYSTCMALGFLLGFLLARWRAQREGIPARHIENLALVSILAGVGGAMAFGKIFYEQRAFWDALKVWQPGGRVYYGGFICVVVGIILYCLTVRVPVLRMLDVFSPAAAIGLAIGRIGCFLGGCCWGDVSPRFLLAVSFPRMSLPYQQHSESKWIGTDAARSLPVHPVQLYETAAVLLLCWYLHRSFHPERRAGAVFARLLIGYAVIRFAVEFLRADNARAYAGLTLAQVIALCIVMATSIVSITFSRRLKARTASSCN